MKSTETDSNQDPAHGISSEDLAQIRRLLLDKRAAIAASQESRLSELSDPSDKHHLADLEEMASDTAETESIFQIMGMEGSTVAQIDAALDRLDAGTFGVCEGCQETIPRARIEALPFASLCVTCQRQRELHPDQV